MQTISLSSLQDDVHAFLQVAQNFSSSECVWFTCKCPFFCETEEKARDSYKSQNTTWSL